MQNIYSPKMNVLEEWHNNDRQPSTCEGHRRRHRRRPHPKVVVGGFVIACVLALTSTFNRVRAPDPYPLGCSTAQARSCDEALERCRVEAASGAAGSGGQHGNSEHASKLCACHRANMACLQEIEGSSGVHWCASASSQSGQAFCKVRSQRCEMYCGEGHCRWCSGGDGEGGEGSKGGGGALVDTPVDDERLSQRDITTIAFFALGGIIVCLPFFAICCFVRQYGMGLTGHAALADAGGGGAEVVAVDLDASDDEDVDEDEYSTQEEDEEEGASWSGSSDGVESDSEQEISLTLSSSSRHHVRAAFEDRGIEMVPQSVKEGAKKKKRGGNGVALSSPLNRKHLRFKKSVFKKQRRDGDGKNGRKRRGKSQRSTTVTKEKKKKKRGKEAVNSKYAIGSFDDFEDGVEDERLFKKNRFNPFDDEVETSTSVAADDHTATRLLESQHQKKRRKEKKRMSEKGGGEVTESSPFGERFDLQDWD